MRFCILFILLSILFFPSLSHAFSVSIGGTTWYTWWQPYWNKRSLLSIPDINIKPDRNIKPIFMNGPVISIGLGENWNISSKFLIGTFKVNKIDIYLTSPPSPLYNNQKIIRYDSDSTIKYSFNEYFNIFLGFKYMNYTYNKINCIDSFYYSLLGMSKIIMQEYAPGFGIGICIPIINNIFFLFDSSVIFCISTMEAKSISFTRYQNPLPQKDNITFYRIGMNANASFAYLFSQINTSFMIGFRYQMLQIIKHNKPNPRGRDHFYGITASAVYRWNL